MKTRNLYYLMAILTCSLIACGNTSTNTNDTSSADDIATTEEPEQANGNAEDTSLIVISKETMTLKLYDSQDRLICSFPVAMGKNLGNKQRSGDMKTPEGDFYIEQIQPASHWGHDFKDGKGFIPHCYGNWFMRLKTPPHTGIGIHGTHAPESIGTRATEGCIRLHNNDLDSLYAMVRVGMPVRIETSKEDQYADGVRYEPIDNDPPVEFTVDQTVAKDTLSVWHTVVSGDRGTSIAKRYGLTLNDLASLNPNINIEKLSIGQQVRVSGYIDPMLETPEAVLEDGKWYTVRYGDCGENIAEKFGLTMEELSDLNPNIKWKKLKPGQEIRVVRD